MLIANTLVIKKLIVPDDNFIDFRRLIQFTTKESCLKVSLELIATDLADKINHV